MSTGFEPRLAQRKLILYAELLEPSFGRGATMTEDLAAWEEKIAD